ncbi:MAG: exodeoxyribonuclease V subunit gamma [Gracilimonas sp.]
MFYIHQSHSLKHLSDHFSLNSETDPNNPLKQTWIIVQNNEIKEWLSLQFASKNEIAGNFRFIFPSEFLWILYRLKNKEIPQLLPADLTSMTWALFELLSEYDDLLKLIPFYDIDSDTPKKRFQFCTQLADNFDQYQVYRPLMADSWLKNKLVTKHKDEGWQSVIWRRLNETWDSSSKTKNIPNRAQAFIDLLKWIDGGDSELLNNIPDNLYVFGLSNTPKPFIEILSKIGIKKDVHFYTKEVNQFGKNDALLTLIKSWEESFRGQSELLVKQLKANNTKYVVNNISDRVEAELPTIDVHSCHNKRREAQVLKDEILRFLDINPGSNSSDILVMVPDIELYAGILETVFENEEDEPSLPLSRLTGKKQQSTEHALSELLGLLSSDFKASQVLQFINLEPVKKRFSFSDDEMDLLEQWVLDNRIHWGLGEAVNSNFSWNKGVSQLLSGFAMQQDSLNIFEGLVPFQEISSSDDANLSARLSRLINNLNEAVKEITMPRNPVMWFNFTEKLVKTFFGDESTNSTQKIQLFLQLNKLKEQASYTRGDHDISFDLFKSWLIGQLESHSSASGRFGQGITVSSYIPYRSVPFKFTGVLGMNEGVFPRKAVRPEYDLINADPKPGDRILKEDDTYLFLETIQAAQKHLHLSYLGQDQRTDSIRLPSILIQQLLDVIAEEPVDYIKRHSLHPFNSRYFQGENGNSYSGSNQRIAQKLSSNKTERPKGFLSKEFNTTEFESGGYIQISDFISFFVHPCKYFLQNKLDIKNYDEFNAIPDREPFKLAGLDKYILDQFLFQSLQKNEPVTQVYKFAKAADMIPESLQGKKSFEHENDKIQKLRNVLNEKATEEESEKDISIQIKGVEIKGSINGIYGDTLISFRAGARRARHEVEHWLKHLLLLEAGVSITKSLYLSIDKSEVDVLELQSANITHNPLADYVEWYLSIKEFESALAFFPESSKAYASSYIDKKEKSKAIYKAKSKWEDDKFKFNAESTDFYNHTIWRYENPLLKESFHKNALTFWEPFIEAGDV